MNDDSNYDWAVVYQAFGEKYLLEAISSVRSLRLCNPSIKVYLYTNRSDPRTESLGIVTLFRQWPPGMLSKVRALADLPENRFVWIDTDTFVCGSLGPIKLFLDRYGISAALEPLRDARRWLPIDLGHEESQLFLEMNCGVIAINRELLPSNFFERWFAMQVELGRSNAGQALEAISDQYGLRILLGSSNLAAGILPNEFNFRACYPQTINTSPIIIHCRSPDPSWVKTRLAEISDLTLWLPFGLTLSRGGFIVRGCYWILRLFERAKRLSKEWFESIFKKVEARRIE